MRTIFEPSVDKRRRRVVFVSLKHWETTQGPFAQPKRLMFQNHHGRPPPFALPPPSPFSFPIFTHSDTRKSFALSIHLNIMYIVEGRSTGATYCYLAMIYVLAV